MHTHQLRLVTLGVLLVVPLRAVGGPSLLPLHEQYLEEHKQEILRVQLARLKEEEREMRRKRAAVRVFLERLQEDRDERVRTALHRHLGRLQDESDEIAQAQEVIVALQHDRDRYRALLVDALKSLKGRHHPQVRRAVPDEDPRWEQQTPELDAVLRWPVELAKEISAGYLDEPYRKRFGMDHYGVDLPVAQGSDVLAAADGVVVEAQENGYGFNAIRIEHSNALSTLYGHVSEILVKEGDHVSSGERIARSGGRPGTKGAGLLTTGPHLHFEAHVHGEAVDPLYYLPSQQVNGFKTPIGGPVHR